ncbi:MULTISPECIES: hypothetical protein [Chryseobacterium]|uniref:Uncharacterized protein n=1 Tax=Chryseobacterium taihuense TaxID=1141221 RepID=A0A4U8WFH7_9FLAO|nr:MULTISPECIES: hypothetical protein [Chryseobacterium]QQV02991.1 hypothetical protein I6I61_01105 [Chryseobacterium sp. FDAARGOS 1104]VFB03725.1 Uncharacterised protein [Chryseobacterium taihuense]
MENRDIIIRKILEKLYIEFNPEILSKLTLQQYKDLFFSVFEYINFYKDKYHLIEEDFVDFSKKIHLKYNYDEYNDNCWERVAFFMDELIFRFATSPPYFFHSNFKDFKDKFGKDFTEGNGL